MAINLYELICPEKNMDSHFLNASSAGRESYTKSVVNGIQTFGMLCLYGFMLFVKNS